MSEIIENNNSNSLELATSQTQAQPIVTPQMTPQTVEQRKGFHIFYLFPMAYVLSVYVMMAYIYTTIVRIHTPDFFEYCIYLPLVFGVCNIIAVIIFGRQKNRIMMLNAAVLVKYALVPFYLLGALEVFATAMAVVPLFFLGPMIAGIEVIAGWLILALGAPYTIAYLHLSRKQKLRPRLMTILHGFLQFFFTVDVIDVMVLTLRERRWKKATIAVIILVVIWAINVLLLAVTIFGAVASSM